MVTHEYDGDPYGWALFGAGIIELVNQNAWVEVPFPPSLGNIDAPMGQVSSPSLVQNNAVADGSVTPAGRSNAFPASGLWPSHSTLPVRTDVCDGALLFARPQARAQRGWTGWRGARRESPR